MSLWSHAMRVLSGYPRVARALALASVGVGASVAEGGPSAARIFARFDSASDTIQIPGNSVMDTAATFEAVVRLPPGSSGSKIWNEWQDFQCDKQFSVNTTSLSAFAFGASGTVFAAPTPVTAGFWHHVAYTYDGAVERLYLDGVQLAFRPESGNIADNAVSRAVGAIFRDGGVSPSGIFDIDSLRISNTARYTTTTFTPPDGDMTSDASTLLLYNFNEATETESVIDEGPLARHGTPGAGFAGATAPTKIADCNANGLDDFEELAGVGGTQSFGPLFYFGAADSPFDLSNLGTLSYLEDFEDGALNVPGVSVNQGAPAPPGVNNDSVDEDDGLIDGSGQAGWEYSTCSGATLTFTFDNSAFGRLPTFAGVVWTDGSPGTSVVLDVFDENGTIVATVNGSGHADGAFNGGTFEDRFYGASYPPGIGAIRIRNTNTGNCLAVDHLQYGVTAVDRNLNGLPDACDIASSASQDCNENGIPDEVDLNPFGNPVELYTDRGFFQAISLGLDEPPLQDGVTGNFTRGQLTFSAAAGSALQVGGTVFSNLVPGFDLVVSGPENFNIDLAKPVSALGFDMSEHTNSTPDANSSGCGGGCPCIESVFRATLLRGGSIVGFVDFEPANDVAQFIGLGSSEAFDRVEIRELVGDCDNEFFGNFIVGTVGDATDRDANGVLDVCQSFPSTLFVDDDAAPGGDGLAWTTALNDLQSALTVAAGGDVSEIRVAGGTYRPAPPGGSQNSWFTLIDGVALRGGYAGLSGGNPNTRDLTAHPSLLSGDLNADDAPGFANYADNTRHVVLVQSGATATTVLDGFTIVGGDADGTFSDESDRGGGILVRLNAQPTVIDCTFERNRATRGGGGHILGGIWRGCVFRGNTSPNLGAGAECGGTLPAPAFYDCLFEANIETAGSGGGCYVSRGTFVNCRFIGNVTPGSGGGAECSTTSSGSSFTNCLFSGNVAFAGGGLSVSGLTGAQIAVTNCTFSNNVATGGCGAASCRGAGIRTSGSGGGGSIISNCVLWGNTDAFGQDEASQIRVASGLASINYCNIQGLSGALGGVGNIGIDPLFIDPDGADDIAGNLDDNLRLAAGSPAIDAGDNARVPPDAGDLDADGNTTEPTARDLDGNIRFFNDPSVSDTGAGTPPIVDMGPYEAGAPEQPRDCNGNSIDDAEDIGSGASQDCNVNGVPDECEPDSDFDGVIDDCDGCPLDPLKIDPGKCGCGQPEGTCIGLPADDSTVALYRFQESSPGNVADSSGQGNHANDFGTTTIVNGPFGRARLFDGVDDRIELREARLALQGTTRLTMEFITRDTGGNEIPGIINHDCSNGFFLSQSGTSLTQGIKTTSGGSCGWTFLGSAAAPALDGDWHYYALVYDASLAGGQLRAFRDGVLIAAQNASGGFIDNGLSSLEPFIGFDTFANEFSSGAIDEVRFSNVARSDFEIAATFDDLAGSLADCNGNGVPDAQDIANGTSADRNGNGVPDECEIAPVIDLPDFPQDTMGFTLVNSAVFEDGALVLNPGSGGSGAAWYTAQKSFVQGGFDTTFTFNMVPFSGSADGIAFVIQDDAPDTFGDGGSGMGYADLGGAGGITRSLAVEFDPYTEGGEFPANHVSIQTDGVNQNRWEGQFSLGHAQVGTLVGQHTARVLYTPSNQTMAVFLDDLTTPLFTATVNLADLDGDNILDPNGRMWVGFTASTGGISQLHEILSWSFLELGEAGPVGNILYVNDDAAPGGDGLSWATAFNTLQDALDAATASDGGVDQVWVAGGTYKPDAGGGESEGDRNATFRMPGGVAVYGGFAGDEKSLNERDFGANPTILSGAIGAASTTDNSFHVVTFNGVGSARLDGFIVRDGNANIAGGNRDVGAGVLAVESVARLENCIIQDCTALQMGGGVHASGSNLDVMNCLLERCSAGAGGGLGIDAVVVLTGDNDIYRVFSTRFARCTATGNSGGGAIGVLGAGANVVLANAEFVGNQISAALQGQRPGAAVRSDSPLQMGNCTFYYNDFGAIADSIIDTNDSASAVNCIIVGNNARDAWSFATQPVVTYTLFSGTPVLPGTGNLLGFPLFVDAAGADQEFGTGDDDLRLLADSPGIDAGFNDGVFLDLLDLDRDGVIAEPLPLDIEGDARFADEPTAPDTGVGTPPIIDMGASERNGSAIPGSVLLVDDDAPPGGDGLSWATAFNTLQDALSASDASAGAIDQIWIAQGVYTPDTGAGVSAGDRSATFNLRNNLAILGGFEAGDESATARDPKNNPTILSGDLNGDDTTGGSTGENSLHVVTAQGVDQSAVLDSVIVRAGNASAASGINSQGGGAMVLTAAPAFNACVFDSNRAASAGGAVRINSGAAPTFGNCTFLSNAANRGGAVAISGESIASFSNCSFQGNTLAGTGAGDGGAVHVSGASAAFVGSAFDSNSAFISGSRGGAIYAFGSALSVGEGCTFTANASIAAGGAVCLQSAGDYLIRDSAFDGNGAANLGGAVYCLSGADARIVGCTMTDNTAGRGGAIMIERASPEIVSCRLLGNFAFQGGGGVNIFDDSSPRLFNCLIAGNSADSRGGGIEVDTNCFPEFGQCTIAFNQCDTSGQGGGLNVVAGTAPSTPTVYNSVLWGNTDNDDGNSVEADQIRRDGAALFTVNYNVIEGFEGVEVVGTANLDADPAFLDPDGANNKPGDADDDYRVGLDSSAIDSGSNSLTPADVGDVDLDGDTSEPLPFDLDGNPRRFDVAEVSDTGEGAAPIIDRGALERVTGDCDGDGIPDSDEIAAGAEDCNANGIPDECELAELIVYQNDFEGTIGSEWSDPTAETTPVGARRFLGRFGNNPTTLNLGNLPAHNALRIELDLFIIDTWDGSGGNGPDQWRAIVDGTQVFNATFSGYTTQSYPGQYPGADNPPTTGASEVDTLGYGTGAFGDSVYRVVLDVPHSASTLALTLQGAGLQELVDESWGIDNITVSISGGAASGDCNANGILDDCDIADGTSQDCNANGIPDECEVAGTGGGSGGALPDQFYGPTPYLSLDDKPFESSQTTAYYVEDFTDGQLNAPGLSASTGVVASSGGFVDSVDADDGSINGVGSTGGSFYTGNGINGITFNFDDDVLGGYPTVAGVVWTDASVPSLNVTLQAFDSTGSLIGSVSGTLANTLSPNGSTDEDRFFGVSHAAGISAIRIFQNASDMEVDHIQYGFAETASSAGDCNNNGVPDECDIAQGTSLDCNLNGVPDECDITSGTSEDCNRNGIPDECEVSTPPLADGLLGPLPYFSEADSLFDLSGLGQTAFLENCEDGLFNVPGVSAPSVSIVGPGGLTDSVDGDDGVIDGSGTNGRAMFTSNGQIGISYNFNTDAFGRLPQFAGIVWTDGSGLITFEAFDQNGISLGGHTGGDVADSVFNGTTAEDRFYGFVHADGISRITISNSEASIEADHLQYGVFPTGSGNDCNQNGIPDECDIASGFSEDCNQNGIPDECDGGCAPGGDCNANGVPDNLDISSGTSADCNLNGIPDECEIAGNTLNSRFPLQLIDNTTGAPDSTYTGAPDDLHVGLGNARITYGLLGIRLIDGPGPDLNLYEVDFGGPEPNLVDVQVSDDGVNYVSISGTIGPAVDLPGDEAHGSPSFRYSFDLAGSGLASVRFIRLQGTAGNPPGGDNGFDPDAIGLVNARSDIDLDQNGQIDTCGGVVNDCNTNGIEDAIDIASGNSEDADQNGVPDECEGGQFAEVMFVDATAQPGGDGLAWDSAFRQLQDGLDAARASNGIVKALWVANGTYRPDRGASQTQGDRDATFTIPEGLELFGGFRGNETALSQRDPAANPSILSADLSGNDETTPQPGTMTDNARHIVTGPLEGTARIDGFVLQGGNADGSGLDGRGAAVLIHDSLTIAGCTLRFNRAAEAGGAVRLGTGSALVDTCEFESNTAPTGGAIAGFFPGATLAVFNSAFDANQAQGLGGALYFDGGTSLAVMVNSAFTGNTAGAGGAAVMAGGGAQVELNQCFVTGGGSPGGLASAQSASLKVHQSLVMGAAAGAGAQADANSSVQVFNSIVRANAGGQILASNADVRYSNIQGGAIGDGNIDVDPLLADLAGPDGVVGTRDDDPRLSGASPCIDAGSNALVPEDGPDLDGDQNTAEPLPLDIALRTRILDNPFISDTGAGDASGTVDIGPYEFQSGANSYPFGFSAITIDDAATGVRSAVAADLDLDGDLDLAAAGGGQVRWYRNDGQSPPLFTPLTAAAFAQASVVAAGDIDGDGDTDLVVAATTTGAVAWLESDGLAPPTFTVRPIVASGAAGAADLIVADVDNDSDADIAIAAPDADSVLVFENSGLFPVTFTQRTVSTSAFGVREIDAADLDADGDTDLVAALTDTSTVVWYENSGASPPVWTPRTLSSTATDVLSVLCADADRDGDLDVLASLGGLSRVIWLENDGAPDPLFAERILSSTLGQPRSLVSGDFDQDGDADVAAGAASDNAVMWFDSSGAALPAFSPRLVGQESTGVDRVICTDLDGDGDDDLVFASAADARLAYHENQLIHRVAAFRGGGTQVATVDSPTIAVPADLDGDGDIDLVSTSFLSDTVSWHRNNDGAGGSWSTLTISPSSAPVSLRTNAPAAASVGDLDGDGDLDVAVVSLDNDRVSWFENDGLSPPNFTAFTIASNADGAAAVDLADLDLDGDLDIVVTTVISGRMLAYRNNGAADPAFTAQTLASGIFAPLSVDLADLDADGDPDALCASNGDNTIAWWENPGTQAGSWTKNTITATATGVSQALAHDVDGDGVIDVVAVISGADRVSYWRSSGGSNPVFTEQVIDADAQDPGTAAIADLDGDGDADIVVGYREAGTVVWFENDGDAPAGFDVRTLNSTNNVSSLAAADITRDGRADVAAAIFQDDRIKFFRNSGGQFAFTTANAAPAEIVENTGAAILTIDARHRGRPGDTPAELATIALAFASEDGLPFSGDQAQATFSLIELFRDDGDEVFDPALDGPPLVSLDEFAMEQGVLRLTAPDGAPDAQIPTGPAVRYFVAVTIAGDAVDLGPGAFIATHRILNFSLAEDAAFDEPLRLTEVNDQSSSLVSVMPDTSPTLCPGDADRDNDVDFNDLNMVLTSFGQEVEAGTNGDSDGTGFVDFNDLNLVLVNFGQPCTPE